MISSTHDCTPVLGSIISNNGFGRHRKIQTLKVYKALLRVLIAKIYKKYFRRFLFLLKLSSVYCNVLKTVYSIRNKIKYKYHFFEDSYIIKAIH